MRRVKKIVGISRTDASELSSLCRISSDKITLSEQVNWQEIHIKVPADLVLSTKTENKQLLYTAKLSFQCCDKWKDLERAAYKVRLADGSFLLVGDKERPYPTAEMTQNLTGNDSSSMLEEVTISFTSPYAIAQIV